MDKFEIFRQHIMAQADALIALCQQHGIATTLAFHTPAEEDPKRVMTNFCPDDKGDMPGVLILAEAITSFTAPRGFTIEINVTAPDGTKDSMTINDEENYADGSPKSTIVPSVS